MHTALTRQLHPAALFATGRNYNQWPASLIRTPRFSKRISSHIPEGTFFVHESLKPSLGFAEEEPTW
jgi:hypothetical protein